MTSRSGSLLKPFGLGAGWIAGQGKPTQKCDEEENDEYEIFESEYGRLAVTGVTGPRWALKPTLRQRQIILWVHPWPLSMPKAWKRQLPPGNETFQCRSSLDSACPAMERRNGFRCLAERRPPTPWEGCTADWQPAAMLICRGAASA